MFNKDYSRKFAIRKLKVTTASVFIGLSFLGVSEVSAQNLKAGVEKEVNYKYVLDSELTEAEKNLIVKELPSSKVSEYETYYMVYKEENGTVLPKTKAIVTDNFDYITAALGAGLVLLALKYSKKRRKIIVSSIFILTAVGTYSVSAIENVKLAGYDKVFTLKTGEALPETKLEIDKHKFVGYILVDNKKDIMEPCPEESKKAGLAQGKVGDKAQTQAPNNKTTQVEQGQERHIVSKGGGLVQEAKPEVHIPVTTSAATQAPVTQVVTVAPVTQTKAEATITEVVTEAPVTKVITEAPVTRVVTEAPVTKIITEAPVTKVITEAPVTRVVTEAPVSRVIAKPGQNLTHEKPEVQVVTEAPVTRIVTEVPVSRIITETPVTKIVTEAPATRIEIEPGTTRVVTEEATTRVIGKAPALVQEAKPIIPIVTSKSIPVVEEAKPEAPVPEITSKGRPLEKENKPEILIETSKGTPLEQEEKPELPLPTTVATTTVSTTQTSATTTTVSTETTTTIQSTISQTETTTKVVVDKTKLEAEYGLENDSKQTDKYKYATDDLRNAYDKLLTEANTILANPNATQAEVDEALKLLTDARVKLNGLLVESTEEKEFTRIIDFVDETGKSIRATEEQKVKFIRTVIKNANTNQVVEEKAWASDKDFFDKFVPPGIEGYKTDETEVPQLPIQILATPETTRVNVRYTKVEDKLKPELKVTKLERFDKENRATLTFDLTDKDITYVKGQVLVYNEKNELVQTVDIKDNKVDLSNLEHCIPYKLETVLTYNLGKGNVEEKVDTRTVELVDKRIEFKNLISTELYKVDDAGKATPVTALTSLPNDKENYMIKLVDSENKEILLAVNNIVEKDGKYQVSAKMENLVHYSADKASDDFVFEVNKAESKPGYHTNFKDLITEMKANPSGQFFLASDLVAEETAESAYITTPFTGTLTSAPGSKFSITGLTKPLFNSLSGKVNNIELKDAVITTAGANVGILANTANGANIDGVTIKGSIKPTTAPDTIGVVAGRVENTTVNNSYIAAEVTLPNASSFKDYNLGGVYGVATSSNITKTNVNVNVDVPALGYTGASIAGLAGTAQGGNYKNVQVLGNIKVSEATGEVAAIIGNTNTATLSDIIARVNVTNGSKANGYNMMAMFVPIFAPTNIFTVQSESTGGNPPHNQRINEISKAEADKKAQEWGLPTGISSSAVATTGAGTSPTSSSAATYPVDYMQVTGAKAGFETAYKNLAKLLPFYDRKTIVKIANKLAEGDKLKETAITSIVPMKGNDFVTDLFDTAGVNKLLVHFADGTVKEYDLTATGESPNARITEFRLDNGMLYTPHNFDQGQNNYDAAIAKLQAVEYNSDEVAKVFNVTKDKLPDLYLETSFNEVKANLDQVLKSIMSNQVSADMTNGAVSRFVENELTKNKEKLLLGLAYLNRLYDINYGDKNIKNLVMYRPDFLTDSKVDNIAYLESLTDTSFDSFKLYEAGALYKAKLAGLNGEPSIPEYLDKYRQLFAPDKETKKWFLESSKAKIVEADTNIPNENNSIYDRLAEKDATHGNLLLLLNVADDTVYAVVHPGSISYGGYAPYMPKNTGVQVEELVDKYAQRMTNYYNIWNNVIKEDMKSKFAENPVRIVDSHYSTSEAETWTNKYPNSGPINEFFGPAGYYHSHNPNESAYANRKTLINMVDDRLLDDASLATATHEFIHHFDEKVLFNGYKYRPGQNVESYALGLLESLSGERSTYYGFNTLYEFTPEKNINFNHSTTRFQSAQDMQDYMKGIFDVTYTLDALEADIMKSKPATDKQKLYQQVTLVPTEPVDGYTHADDSIIDLSNDITNKLTSIQAFVENGVVSKGILNVDGKQVFTRDNKNPNYAYVDLYKPIFAGLSNNAGTVGSLQFRRTTLEFLAAKGWDEGFLKYATNKLAVDNGKNLTDPEVFKEIFGTEYANYADFKTKQFENHLADISKLKEITITLNGKQEVVNGTTIKGLMERAVNEQLNPKNFQQEFALKTLKEAILTEYMKQTGDFKESIYK